MRNFRGFIEVFLSVTVILFLSGLALTQAPQPDGAGVKPGSLPRTWLLGGPKCIELPEFQVHEYNEDFYILRQSGCSNFEKPFLYLLFGKDKALLLDTGAGKTDVARVVNNVITRWLARNKKGLIELVVAHTHAHKDHTGGDDQFKSLQHTTLVLPDLKVVQSFFDIKNWPEEIVQYDLGDRILDVIPIPGHDATSIAIYDRQTAILLTGDTLYPGRLYVRDPVQFVNSIQRLVDFTRNKVVAHILGNHIENTRTPYLDYRAGTVYQPDEHSLELGRAELLELNDALHQMKGKIVRMAMRDFTVWPMP
ncbi:MAG TPA: MBL fold metallo-hydrolase [Blastocatellia bacterium]|nr:MBL fold metallo-hydrolase [Blastocatellia bacterium]